MRNSLRERATEWPLATSAMALWSSVSNASSNLIRESETLPGLNVRAFNCQCGNPVFFQNSVCLACRTPLGYAPEAARLLSLAATAMEDVWVECGTSGPKYRRCANLHTPAGCNWLVPLEQVHRHAGLCRACRLNRRIPDLNDPQHPDNGALWRRVELAKRRLVSHLLVMGLPVASREAEDLQHGLMFDLLRAPLGGPPVMIGHGDGSITLDVLEADDVYRERVRSNMNEPYRTLIGHLRHEVGHYYWDRLIQGTPWHAQFRALFGDETQNYADSLQQYYDNGPPENWQLDYVSAYATAHPWEAWAECWAHYMHMSDMVDTASSYGLTLDKQRLEIKPFTREVLYRPDHPGAEKYLAFINHWTLLTMLMNGMSRAMGQPDLYPFVLAHQVVSKLHFIHLVVSQERHRMDDKSPPAYGAASQTQD